MINTIFSININSQFFAISTGRSHTYVCTYVYKTHIVYVYNLICEPAIYTCTYVYVCTYIDIQ